MLWRVEEHELLTERLWDLARVRDCVEKVRAEAESALSDGVWPVHPRDGEDGQRPLTTLYLGSAGVVWALHRLGSTTRLAAIVERALQRYRAEPDFAEEAHPPSLWMGEAGLLVVAALVGSAAADQVRLRELIRQNQTHPTWELMWGSPGSILAAKACGLEEEWRSAALPLWECWDASTDLWTQELYGRVAQRLGPAHGFAGNAHALRGFTTDGRLRERIGRALEATALREDELVNWPPSATPLDGIDFPIRVQWCHGAPGIVATLGDLMPQELAEAAAELVWRAGSSKKPDHNSVKSSHADAVCGSSTAIPRLPPFRRIRVQQRVSHSR